MTTVSVIIPTFNRTNFLKVAIESVYSQTFTDWEIVVADDGSGEETRRYLRGIEGPRLRTVWLPHSGNPSLVRNAAVAVAGGRYLAFLDSDDAWFTEKLEKQIAALRNFPHCRWSYTACRHVDEGGILIPKKRRSRASISPEGWIFDKLLKLEIGIAMPTVVTERSLFDEAGGFDEQQRFGEFHDLCLRLALKGEVVVVPEPLCSVRTHNEHYSSDKLADHADWMRLYQKMAGIADSPRLRSHCARMRAETSLSLAAAHGENRDYRKVGTTLWRALPFSWRYPNWWWGALKRIVRPSVPNALVSAVRQRRKTE